MIRMLIVALVLAVMAVILGGCATADVAECVLPQPPAELLIVPKPLPPVPVDLPGKP